MKTAVVLTGLLVALTISAQELQQAPDNPAFLKYQQERIQKASVVKTVSGHGLGYVPPPVDLSYLRGRIPAHTRTLQALPSSYDLRTKGKLTPIKDQDPYGTCWAFATYSSLESTLMPAEERYFSVNNMANNHGFDYEYDDGGNAVMSTAYLARWSGPINETDDPYSNGPGHSPANLTVQKHVQEVLLLSLKASALDNTTIKQAVVNYGAMYVSMYIANAYYDSINASYYYSGTADANHAVAIVGWNDNYPATNFVHIPAGNGAFIVRNSWGTNWGEQGYFYCSYYDSVMGYDENTAFNNAEAVTKYSSIYQYDPLGRVNDIGYSSTTAWGANIFTVTDSGTLRAVGFYATDIDMNYRIYIYRNITAGSPRSGTLELMQTGACAYSGYHTVTLNTPITLSSGQLFSVVIEFSNSSYIYPVAFEYALAGYSSRATSSPGQSYTSSDGTSWSDLTTYESTANVCIKAFCGTGGGIPVASIAGDFDGDGKADPAVVTADDVWTIWLSDSGYAQVSTIPLYVAGGVPVAGDFDGDGRADMAMVTSNGVWTIWASRASYAPASTIPLYVAGGVPVAGDFDKDGKADFAVVAPTGVWKIWMSGSSYVPVSTIPLIP